MENIYSEKDFDLSEKEKALGLLPDETRDSGSSETSASLVDSGTSSDDENLARGNWSGRLDFFLSCVGYAVGLGNIWRFPYLCYQSGGGAFLIPYVFFLLTCGIPMFFLEISFGQFASLSPTTIWKISPLFKGVGYGMVIVSGIVCVYYNVIITWTLYFLAMSLRAVLPWATCDNSWNTDQCVLHKGSNQGSTNVTSAANVMLGLNTTDIWNSSEYSTPQNMSNMTFNTLAKKYVSASEEFWQREVLQITDGIEDVGDIRWQLLICLFVSWVVVFFCLCKGIKTSGKVVYFTATFPYIVLLILLIRGVTLPGAGDGIKYYLIPQWEKILTFKVWGDAAVQIFYSVGMAWGGIITMASYNRFHNNCYRDAMVVPFINCGTSIFAGLVVFSILGFLAQETGQKIEDVVTQGPGLVFVTYPETVAKLPISPLWAVLFFVMLFTVGLDTQFGMFETMTSAFVDEFPTLLRNRKMMFTAFMCFISFLMGIPCITQGGIYILQIMDWYCSTFSLMLLSFCECFAISWVYGVDRFYKDIELMIGFQPHIWWKYSWKFVTPITIVFIWLFSMVMLAPVTYGDYEYPTWAIVIGWMMGLCSLLPLPINAVIQIYRRDGTLLQRIKKAAHCTTDWGPAVDKHRQRYLDMLESLSSCHGDETPPPVANWKELEGFGTAGEERGSQC